MKKVKIINTVTGEIMQALYNPDELTERITAKYTASRRLRGLPSLRYEQTSRQQFTMTFYVDDAAYEGNEFIIGEFRRFLSSLLYPVRLSNGELKDPPSILFVWSGLLSELCKVVSAQFHFARFRESLLPEVYTAETTLQECGYTVISSEGRRNDYLILEAP